MPLLMSLEERIVLDGAAAVAVVEAPAEPAPESAPAEPEDDGQGDGQPAEAPATEPAAEDASTTTGDDTSEGEQADAVASEDGDDASSGTPDADNAEATEDVAAKDADDTTSEAPAEAPAPSDETAEASGENAGEDADAAAQDTVQVTAESQDAGDAAASVDTDEIAPGDVETGDDDVSDVEAGDVETGDDDVSDVEAGNDAGQAESPASPEAAAAQDDADDAGERRLLVINEDLADHEDLAAAARDNVVTVSYSADDSVDEILEALQASLDGAAVNSLAWATHSSAAGSFQLSEDIVISTDSLLSHPELASFWESVGALVAPDGRIDLLACSVVESTDATPDSDDAADAAASAPAPATEPTDTTAAEEAVSVGETFVNTLASIAGVQLAASDDATGNEADGGDWVLEHGGVDVAPLYFKSEKLREYDGLMANLIGTNASETINGTAGDDIIFAGDGDDTVFAGDGDDIIQLVGSDGDNSLLGEAGVDQIFSSDSGSDTLDGGAGNDSLFGHGGQNLLRGGDGDDRLQDSGAGASTLQGGAGDDELTLYDGDIADYSQDPAAIVVNLDADTVQDGYGGVDTLAITSSSAVVQGSNFGDTLIGDNGRNILHGGEGADSIDGGGNRDTLRGDAGDDFINAGWSEDWAYGGDGNDYIIDEHGYDTLFGDDGDDTLMGGSWTDHMYGGAGDDGFVMNVNLLTANSGENRQIIYDFQAGDTIYLNGIDADSADVTVQTHNSTHFRLYLNGYMFNGADILTTTLMTSADIESRIVKPTVEDAATTDEASVTLGLSNFGISEADHRNPNMSIDVTSLASAGKVQLDGVDVAVNQNILAEDIAAGKLVYTPDALDDSVQNGSDQFNYVLKNVGHRITKDVSDTKTLTIAIDNPQPPPPPPADPPPADPTPTISTDDDDAPRSRGAALIQNASFEPSPELPDDAPADTPADTPADSPVDSGPGVNAQPLQPLQNVAQEPQPSQQDAMMEEVSRFLAEQFGETDNAVQEHMNTLTSVLEADSNAPSSPFAVETAGSAAGGGSSQAGGAFTSYQGGLANGSAKAFTSDAPATVGGQTATTHAGGMGGFIAGVGQSGGFTQSSAFEDIDSEGLTLEIASFTSSVGVDAHGEEEGSSTQPGAFFMDAAPVSEPAEPSVELQAKPTAVSGNSDVDELIHKARRILHEPFTDRADLRSMLEDLHEAKRSMASEAGDLNAMESLIREIQDALVTPAAQEVN